MSVDFNKIVESILRLKDELNVPSEEYSEKEDTFTVSNFRGDGERESMDTEEPEIIFVNNTCYQCNGYYGPCFGDPLCATCHLFLYPISQSSDVPTRIPEENGDSDSGNDEPIEPSFRINGIDNSEEAAQRLVLSVAHRHDSSCSSPKGAATENNDIVLKYGPLRIRVMPNVTSPKLNEFSVPCCSTISPNRPRVKTPPVRVDNLTVQLQKLSVPSPNQFEDINFDLFPPEVLIHTFQYLDEISLWSIGQVCSRWRSILFMYMKSEKWKAFTLKRWPLLGLNNGEQGWYELYTAMMKSACCFKCVQQMAAQELPSNWDNNSWRAHRLRTELRVMRTDPLDGIEATPLDPACCHWQATLEGPAGSSYEGGLFFLYIQVPVSYPLTPPIVRFITKIFHPNVSRHGDIGIDSIHQNWSLALTMSKLLISIQSLLTDPFCDVCMEPEICKLYITNRKAFEEQARKWTVKYAMHDLIPH
ncbi:hypothetical protein HHI36_023647 [Cryptolaemus montrouzieri]|uniref:E2 ubiquitin-conjugating enzyme n=1 Tax=Cryptolaemus montrouzieri TaxID=559131 RepID=A0ABD2PHF2_9CUCU